MSKNNTIQIENSKNRTFLYFSGIFVLLFLMLITLSIFSMNKFEMYVVKKSVSQQKMVKIDDLQTSLNSYTGGEEITEKLDNDNNLDQKFINSIQRSHMNAKEVRNLSKDKLSLNQARVLVDTLQKIKIKNIASTAKHKTQSIIYSMVVVTPIIIFLVSTIFLYKTKNSMDKKSSVKFIGSSMKEMVGFIVFSVGLYAIINSAFSGDNISDVKALSQSMTATYAWIPINILLVAGVSLFNIYSEINGEK